MSNEKQVELVNALRVIKETCEAHEYCENCPMLTETPTECGCGIRETTPDAWTINTPPESKWKALLWSRGRKR